MKRINQCKSVNDMYHLQTNVDNADENSFLYIFKGMSLKERENVGSDRKVQKYQVCLRDDIRRKKILFKK